MDHNNRLINYSLQLAYLSKLLAAKMISEDEYAKIKKNLMNDYHVSSDILAQYETGEVW